MVGYSAVACRERWLALQRVRASAGLDALLFIVGPDAHFSPGAEVAFNWLLGGLEGRELLAAALDSKYEECVVCIRADCSFVFCKQAIQQEVIAKTALWSPCDVITPSRSEESDTDAYDARKIGAFIEMVADCASLGVALRESEMSGAEMKMSLERWPLVQAFGYDEFGHGFLTLSRSIVNIEAILQAEVYSSWDMHSAMRAQALAGQLHKVWQDAMLVQDKLCTTGASADETVAAPLLDFFEYGRLSVSDEDIMELRGPVIEELNPAPRVLIGASSSEEVLGATAVPGSARPPAQAEDLHMVWEVVEPAMGVAATRTYVLRSPFAAAGADSTEQRRLGALTTAYAAAAGCVQRLLASAVAEVAFRSDRELVLRQWVEDLIRAEYPSCSGRLQVLCTPIDTMGLHALTAERASGVVLLFLRVAIAGLQCPDTGAPLGTVAYGDSIFCARPGPAAAPTVSTGGGLLSSLPAFAFWPGAEEAPRTAKVRSGLESALGVGFDPGPSVALGHRSGVKVYLEQRGRPPDPLGLGEKLGAEVRCVLALDTGAGPLTATAHGTAWAFESGKVVVSSPRCGYAVLEVTQQWRAALPTEDAEDGLVWVPLEPVAPAFGLTCRLAVTVSPSAVSRWRALAADASKLALGEEAATVAPEALGELQWLRSSASAPSTSLPSEFLEMAALTGAHGGEMLAETVEALWGSHCSPMWGIPVQRASLRGIWVSGLPGCGALDVAAALAKVLQGALLDLQAILGIDRSTGELHATLTEAAEPLLEAMLSQHCAGREWVVVSDVTQAPATAVASWNRRPRLHGLCQIEKVVAVVEASVAAPWTSAQHPLLPSRSLRGWVSAVSVQDHSGGTSAERERRNAPLLLELNSARNDSQVYFRPQTSVLVEGPLQEPIAPVAVRTLALPAGPSSVSEATLHGVFIPSASALDFEVLRAHLKRALAAAAEASCPPAKPGQSAPGKVKASPWRGLFSVEVRARGTSSASAFWDLPAETLRATAQALSNEKPQGLVMTHKSELGGFQNWQWPLATETGVLFWWVLPARAQAQQTVMSRRQAADELVGSCLLRPPTDPRLWSLEAPPAEALSLADTEARAAGSPEGYFFNGTHYVDVDGRASKDHPELQLRLKEVVARHNAEELQRIAAFQEVARLAALAGS